MAPEFSSVCTRWKADSHEVKISERQILKSVKFLSADICKMRP